MIGCSKPTKAEGLLIRRLLLACGAAIAIAFSPATWAANVGIGSNARVDVPVMSMKDLRDKNVVKQRFDYSCGAAALATILKFGFGDDVTEREILTQLFELISAEQELESREKGFSLRELQLVAQARGYQAQGYRLEPQYLGELGGPVIVFIEPRGYKHFAVLRGVRGDRVYLADPSQGNVRMPAYRFLDSWLQEGGKGIIFVVEPKTGLPEGEMPLALDVKGLPQPELMSAREMLAVGSPFVRFPELSR